MAAHWPYPRRTPAPCTSACASQRNKTWKQRRGSPQRWECPSPQRPAGFGSSRSDSACWSSSWQSAAGSPCGAQDTRPWTDSEIDNRQLRRKHIIVCLKGARFKSYFRNESCCCFNSQSIKNMRQGSRVILNTQHLISIQYIFYVYIYMPSIHFQMIHCTAFLGNHNVQSGQCYFEEASVCPLWAACGHHVANSAPMWTVQIFVECKSSALPVSAVADEFDALKVLLTWWFDDSPLTLATETKTFFALDPFRHSGYCSGQLIGLWLLVHERVQNENQYCFYNLITIKIAIG